MSKILKPVLHDPDYNRCSDDYGNQNQNSKILKQQNHEITEVSTENFSYTDFFSLVAECERCDSQQSKAGNQNSYSGECNDNAIDILLIAILLVKIISQRSEEHTSELQSQSNLVC